MSNATKLFHSDMVGAPVLSGTAGALIALLDACLVNGWGVAPVDSVVIAGGIGTVTRGAGHPFEVDMVSELAGATVSGGSINGQHKVLSVAGNSYTFAAPGLADQVASGSITHKVAPLGWDKPFSGTNLAAYRPADVMSTRFFLRVDDTGTVDARVLGYLAMTAISNGTGPFPTEAQQAGGSFWPKSNAASSAARRWVLSGDSKHFKLAIRWNDNTGIYFGLVALFGDVLPESSTDAYRCFIQASLGTLTGTTPGGAGVSEFDVTSGGSFNMVFARSHHGLGGPVPAGRGYPTFINAGATNRSGDGNVNHLPFPNPTNNGIYVSQYMAYEGGSSAPGTLRGAVPGLYAFPQKVGSAVYPHLARVEGLEGLPGRRLAVINTASGCFAFDVTGPG